MAGSGLRLELTADQGTVKDAAMANDIL